MSSYIIQSDTLNNIADAIREKAQITDSMTPLEMPDYINDIETGGGGGSSFIVPLDVLQMTYIDTDGTTKISQTIKNIDLLQYDKIGSNYYWPGTQSLISSSITDNFTAEYNVSLGEAPVYYMNNSTDENRYFFYPSTKQDPPSFIGKTFNLNGCQSIEYINSQILKNVENIDLYNCIKYKGSLVIPNYANRTNTEVSKVNVERYVNYLNNCYYNCASATQIEIAAKVNQGSLYNMKIPDWYSGSPYGFDGANMRYAYQRKTKINGTAVIPNNSTDFYYAYDSSNVSKLICRDLEKIEINFYGCFNNCKNLYQNIDLNIQNSSFYYCFQESSIGDYININANNCNLGYSFYKCNNIKYININTIQCNMYHIFDRCDSIIDIYINSVDTTEIYSPLESVANNINNVYLNISNEAQKSGQFASDYYYLTAILGYDYKWYLQNLSSIRFGSQLNNMYNMFQSCYNISNKKQYTLNISFDDDVIIDNAASSFMHFGSAYQSLINLNLQTNVFLASANGNAMFWESNIRELPCVDVSYIPSYALGTNFLNANLHFYNARNLYNGFLVNTWGKDLNVNIFLYSNRSDCNINIGGTYGFGYYGASDPSLTRGQLNFHVPNNSQFESDLCNAVGNLDNYEILLDKIIDGLTWTGKLYKDYNVAIYKTDITTNKFVKDISYLYKDNISIRDTTSLYSDYNLENIYTCLGTYKNSTAIKALIPYKSKVIDEVCYGCSSLTDIIIGDGQNLDNVISANNAFYGTNLTVYPNLNCLKIADNTFSKCTKLIYVDNFIPNAEILRNTFLDCTSLVDFTSMIKAKNIKSSFAGCSKLNTNLSDKFNWNIITDSSFAFRGCTSLNQQAYTPTKTGSYAYMYEGSGVTSIYSDNLNIYSNAEHAFEKCTNLLPCSSITALDHSNCYYMFSECSKFKTANIKLSINRVGEYASNYYYMFNGCDLSTLYINCNNYTTHYEYSKGTYVINSLMAFYNIYGDRPYPCDKPQLNIIFTNFDIYNSYITNKFFTTTSYEVTAITELEDTSLSFTYSNGEVETIPVRHVASCPALKLSAYCVE